MKDYCQICGRGGETLCSHHLKSKGSGGTDDEDNMITVCANCHGKIHNGKISREEVLKAKAKEIGLVDIGGDF